MGDHSVLLLDEKPHMRQRKLLLPPFHGERMERYGQLMREVAEAEVESWPRGEPLELLPRMQAVTLEVILRAVFGLEQGARLEELRASIAANCSATSWTRLRRLLLTLLGPRRFRRLPHGQAARWPRRTS